jgi:hypothetical protein
VPEAVRLVASARRLAGPAKRHLKRIERALLDEDWAGWLALVGDVELERCCGVIQAWLDEPVDWDEMEWFSNSGWSGQSLAMSFFEDLPFDVRNALGVEIVEGDHPGSTYFAAELRNEVEAANREARRLGVPVRFKESGG